MRKPCTTLNVLPWCSKCGAKKTWWQLLLGLNEWWAYKQGMLYCEKCAPKNSGVAYLGLFFRYKTRMKQSD